MQTCPAAAPEIGTVAATRGGLRRRGSAAWRLPAPGHAAYTGLALMTNRVERAAPTDIALLVDFMEAFHREADFALDRRWATNSFATLLGNPALGAAWLVRRDGAAAGYAVLTVRFSMEYGGTDAFIDDLFVRPEHRRHGVGTAALTGLVAECRRRGALALHVEVGQDNLAANALYQKFGLGLRTDRRQMRTVEFA